MGLHTPGIQSQGWQWRPTPHRDYYRALIATLVVPLAAMIGCGESEPATYPVTGKVSYQGKPLPLGTVRFVPNSGPPSPPAQIDPDGAYQLQAVAGEHRVMVTAVPEPQGARPDPMAEGGMDYSQAKPTQPLIPRKYSSLENSGIVVTVEASESNTIDIHLK